jgi:hypothetical protein
MTGEPARGTHSIDLMKFQSTPVSDDGRTGAMLCNFTHLVVSIHARQ